MQQARILEPVPSSDESPLARARVHRQLTIDEAARRAGVAPEECTGSKRAGSTAFRPPTARCSRRCSTRRRSSSTTARRSGWRGCDVPPIPPEANPLKRFGAITAFAALILAAVLAVAFARNESTGKPNASVARRPRRAAGAVGDQGRRAERQRRHRLHAHGRVAHPGAVVPNPEGRQGGGFNYPQTQVYYPPGGQAIGERLAKQLDVPMQPLPGGNDPKRLVVIVGPEKTVGN